MTYFLFADNQKFLIAADNIAEVEKALEKAENVSLDCRASNIVMYDIMKTESILFFQA